MNASRHNVDLHIERLVLDGFEGVDGAALGAAVEGELARVLAERGMTPSLAAGGHAERVEGERIAAEPGTSTGAFGAQIARAVYGGLKA